jgi:septum formation protein
MPARGGQGARLALVLRCAALARSRAAVAAAVGLARPRRATAALVVLRAMATQPGLQSWSLGGGGQLVQLLPRLEEEARDGRLRVVLASSSPRRRELLGRIVLAARVPFDVLVSGFAEDWDKSLFRGRAREYVQSYATEKARDVERELTLAPGLQDGLVLVIGCDTVVVQDGLILEKPRDAAEAEAMVSSYSARSHDVVSGLCLVLLEVRAGSLVARTEALSACSTRVHFPPLALSTVRAYVETGEPMDKAGGYGIQGLGGMLVSGIEGCYYNCVGLPVFQLAEGMATMLGPRLGHPPPPPSPPPPHD